MNSARAVATLLAKDLRIEAASRHTLGLSIVLGLLIVTVLGLGLGSSAGAVNHAPPHAVLWVAYLFCGVLCFERTMSLERRDDALSALLLAPVPPVAIFLAKLAVNLLLLLALALVVTPVAALFFGVRLEGGLGVLVAVLLLSLLGLAAVGTLFSAVSGASGRSGGLLALLVLPLALPLVIASTRLMAPPAGGGGGVALAVVVAFDVVFIVSGWLAFEALLEP